MSPLQATKIVCADEACRMPLNQAKNLIAAAAELHFQLMEAGYSPDSANGRDPMLTHALASVFNHFADGGQKPLFAPGDAHPHFFVLDKLDDETLVEDVEQRIVEVLCEEFAVALCAALVRDEFKIEPEFPA